MAPVEPIPFSEPPWLQGFPSPYYSDSHRQWQKYCREFMNEHLNPYAVEWERDEHIPEAEYAKWARYNMLIPNLPAPLPLEWLKSVGIETIGPLRIEDFDYTHLAIYVYELKRCGLNGPSAGITSGFRYGVPPLLYYATRSLQERVLPDLLRGKTRTCIAITEPDAGSDVANITTTAEKSEDGKYYIVNGSKKWITNGIWCDYATMAVRTGAGGAAGLSLLLVPLKGQKGVNVWKMKVSGQNSSGTTFMELDDVKVPIENLIGEEDQGMKYVMTNFNHERLTIAVGVTTQARAALASAFAYTMKREAFGAPLINQPVVRHRLAKAGAELETCWAWVESFVHQLCHMPKADADSKLGGLTALCKAKAGMVLNECAQCAQLLFGGAGYTQSGQGELVEKIAREVAASRIPGGSEDVMLDLAIRLLYKNYQKSLKGGATKL